MHDTGRSFEPIFMKFTWLVRVHPWVIPIVFFYIYVNVFTSHRVLREE